MKMKEIKKRQKMKKRTKNKIKKMRKMKIMLIFQFHERGQVIFSIYQNINMLKKIKGE
jgi:cell division protein FtsB